MEGYQEETSVLGKLIARSTSPIRTGHRDCASGSAETEGRDGARDMHQREDLGEVDREREESGMTGKLRVKYLWDNAVLPVRGTAGAAGYDISAASGCVIPAHGKGSVDTGLAVSLPPGTYAQIAPRSGHLEDTDRGNDGFGSTGTHSFVQSTQKNQKGKKKKSPSPSHPRSQQWQAHGSINTVESTEPGSSDLNRVI